MYIVYVRKVYPLFKIVFNYIIMSKTIQLEKGSHYTFIYHITTLLEQLSRQL